MYRCDLCPTVVPPRHPELRHSVVREDGSTLRELRVCRRCHAKLASGATPETLRPKAPSAAPSTPVPQRVTLGRTKQQEQ